MPAADANAPATTCTAIPLPNEVEQLLAPVAGITEPFMTGLPVPELDEHKRAGRWARIQEITAQHLKASKSLEAAEWWVVSAIHQNGFSGARTGLALLKGLLDRYWDSGLQPVEPEERGIALRWLNRRFCEELQDLLVTRRTNTGADFSLVKYREMALQQVRGDGKSSEQWEEAVSSTESSFYNSLSDQIQAIAVSFGDIDALLKKRLEGNAPNLENGSHQITDLVELSERCSRIKGVLAIRKSADKHEISEEDSPDAPPEIPKVTGCGDTEIRNLWANAVQSAQSNLPLGLARMRAIANGEPAGRDVFYRKLSLARVYLSKGKTQPAKIILEELAREIDERKLFEWEELSSIADVWNKLCECRIQTGDSEGAEKLFERLCRLAPWHAVELKVKNERT